MARFPILLLILAGCASGSISQSAATKPVSTRDDTSIPPEMGSDFMSASAPSELPSLVKGFRHGEGTLSFVDVWKVLAQPARSSADYEAKCYFVRYAIPIRGIDPHQFEGGTPELLIAIFRSKQSRGVCDSAMNALVGEGRGSDPGAMLSADSPLFEVLLTEVLAQPDSPRRDDDLYAFVYALSKHESGSQGAPRQLIARTMEATRSTDTLRLVLAAVQFNWRYMKAELTPAVEAIVRDMKRREGDPGVDRVLNQVKMLDPALLKTPDPAVK